MPAFEIPLSPVPQRFSIQLGGVFYRLRLLWNRPANCWVLDVADQNDVPMVQGIPIITGADLLAQYGYLGFGGQLIAQTDSDPYAVPTAENLGTTGHLYFVTPDE